MDFQNKTLSELKDIARANKIKGFSVLKKNDLIILLTKELGSQRPASPRPQRPASPRPQRPASPRPQRPASPTRKLTTPKRCDKLRKPDVVVKATSLGIDILKPNGKAKTIKELCEEIESIEPPAAVVRETSVRKTSVVRQKPSLDVVPAFIVSKILDVVEDMDVEVFLKKVTKADLLKYAQGVDIKGKSMSKSQLLSTILDKVDVNVVNVNVVDVPSVNVVPLDAEEDVFAESLYQKLMDILKDTSISNKMVLHITENLEILNAIDPRMSEFIIDNLIEEISSGKWKSKVAKYILKIQKNEQKYLKKGVNLSNVERHILEDVVRKVFDKSLAIEMDEGRIREVDVNTLMDNLDFTIEKPELLIDVQEPVEQLLIDVEVPEKTVDDVVDNVVYDVVPQESLIEIVTEEEPPEEDLYVRRYVSPENVADIESLLQEIQNPKENVSNISTIQQRVFTCLGLIN